MARYEVCRTLLRTNIAITSVPFEEPSTPLVDYVSRDLRLIRYFGLILWHLSWSIHDRESAICRHGDQKLLTEHADYLTSRLHHNDRQGVTLPPVE